MVFRAKQYKCESLEIPEAFFLTLVGATVVSVRWMYSEWDTVSGWAGFRKMRPRICLWSGMRFPFEGLGGKWDPEFVIGMGCSFPTEPQAENASHSGREFWDTVSGCKKGHMTWPSTYICCGYSHDKPCSNNKVSVRAEAYKVHREFRTQRRPLNVASVLRRTVRAGNLICLRPDRRFSYERPAI